MRLAPDEFIRRFLLHVLPDGFHRIRHYGLLARGDRKEHLDLCRRLAAAVQPAEPKVRVGEPAAAAKVDTTFPCPDCGQPMRRIEIVPPMKPRPFHCDTS